MMNTTITRRNAYEEGYRFTATYITDGHVGQRFFKTAKELEDFTARYVTLPSSTGPINEAGFLIHH